MVSRWKQVIGPCTPHIVRNPEAISAVVTADNANNDVSSLNLRATSILLARTIQGLKQRKPLRVLFDTGSDRMFVNIRALPKGAVPKSVGKPTTVTGLHGTKALTQEVYLSDISLPEFSPTQRIPGPSTPLY